MVEQRVGSVHVLEEERAGKGIHHVLQETVGVAESLLAVIQFRDIHDPPLDGLHGVVDSQVQDACTLCMSRTLQMDDVGRHLASLLQALKDVVAGSRRGIEVARGLSLDHGACVRPTEEVCETRVGVEQVLAVQRAPEHTHGQVVEEDGWRVRLRVRRCRSRAGAPPPQPYAYDDCDQGNDGGE